MGAKREEVVNTFWPCFHVIYSQTHFHKHAGKMHLTNSYVVNLRRAEQDQGWCMGNLRLYWPFTDQLKDLVWIDFSQLLLLSSTR